MIKLMMKAGLVPLLAAIVSTQTIAQSTVFDRDLDGGRYKAMIKSDCTFIFVRAKEGLANVANLKDVQFKLKENGYLMQMFCKTKNCADTREFRGGNWNVIYEGDHIQFPYIIPDNYNEIANFANNKCNTPVQ